MMRILGAAALGACLLVGYYAGYRTYHGGPGTSRRVLYYEDPMHPAYRSDKPGKAPDCGMDLVPVYADQIAGALAEPDRTNAQDAADDAGVQQLYGIRLARAQMDSGRDSLHLYGRVDADESRMYSVNFGTDGYVKETENDVVGSRVHKDQRLAVVYSPDFLSVAGGYLAANEHSPGAPTAARDNFNASTTSQNAASVLARADRLRNLGMSDAQIDEISQSRKLPEDVYIVSPIDGFILARNVSPGMRFERHTDLYQIADLSHVWITAEVFGNEAQAIRVGTAARASIPDSSESYPAMVSAVLPQVDPATRALRVRLQVNNPDFKLRPGMFVNVDLPIALAGGLSIPLDAVLDAGNSKRVYVQGEDHRFQPRWIETGWQAGDRIQVKKGLREGEMVVASGTFLVDSESRLRSPAAPLSTNGPSRNLAMKSSHN